MNQLERRYRWLLRTLPRWYRADREDEMVGIFLAGRTDELDLEHGWPGWMETWAVLALACRVRMGASGGLARAVALGDVVRSVALVGAVAGVAMLGGGVVQSVLLAVDDDLTTTRSWLGLAFEVVPLVAFALLLRGRYGWAKVLTGLVLVPGVLTLVSEPNWPLVWFLAPWWLGFLLLCLGFHREAAAPSVMRWWSAAGVAFVAGALSVVVVGTLETYLITIGMVVVSVVVLAARTVTMGSRGAQA
ncbi:hypothetical protein FKR81_27840 [Lentzea tibetensis]|uniref:Uncharacterized protein n=1 Tax=Lentzea tibetensis TaxID=2591470 RepID=A0A563EP05_9PSEU|nr:hypothetical protein [Lentzea tibetensis]TWP48413.1 hypothetical protein FKR81_27840 [Lentzea tibetensis]